MFALIISTFIATHTLNEVDYRIIFISYFLSCTCDCLCWTIDRSRVGIFVIPVLECYVFQQHLEIWLFCKPMTSIARVFFVSEGEINALTVGMTVSSWCEQSTWFPNPAVSAQGCCLDLPKAFPFNAVILILPRSKTQYLARFVSKNVRESSFYWTGLSLSNNLETKCFSVMLILLFYFCMFIRLLCVSVTLYFYYSFPCNVLCVFNSWICFYLKYYLLSFSVTPGSVCGVP